MGHSTIYMRGAAAGQPGSGPQLAAFSPPHGGEANPQPRGRMGPKPRPLVAHSMCWTYTKSQPDTFKGSLRSPTMPTPHPRGQITKTRKKRCQIRGFRPFLVFLVLGISPPMERLKLMFLPF